MQKLCSYTPRLSIGNRCKVWYRRVRIGVKSPCKLFTRADCLHDLCTDDDKRIFMSGVMTIRFCTHTRVSTDRFSTGLSMTYSCQCGDPLQSVAPRDACQRLDCPRSFCTDNTTHTCQGRDIYYKSLHRHWRVRVGTNFQGFSQTTTRTCKVLY